MSWTERYRLHFQRLFHKPFDIQVYHDRDGFALKLATHDLARPGFRVYGSLGLADRLAQNDEDELGEVILFSDVADPQVPRLFVNALFFILHNDIPLGSRFAIGFGADHPFARQHGKTALYVTQPLSGDEEIHEGEAIGRVYQAFFITPAEDDFLEKHGADAFEIEFRKQFAGKLTEEERVELLVDKAKSQALDARMHELAQQANRALSVRRPSCV